MGLIRFVRIRFHLFLDALFGTAMIVIATLPNAPADGRIPVYVLGVLALLLVFTTKIRAQGTQSKTIAEDLTS